MFGKPQISPELLMGLGGGILSGQNFAQGLGMGMQNASNIMTVQRQEREVKAVENKTREWLQKQFPGEDFNTMSTDMMKMYVNEAFKKRFATPTNEFKVLPDGSYGTWDGKKFNTLGTATKPKQRNLISTKDGIYDADTNQWVTPPAGVQTESSEYGLNPQTALDKDGNPVLIQLSKDGKATQAQLPDGVRLSKEPIKLDAGTHFVLLDPITRQNIGTIPKDLAGAEEQKVIGKTTGENRVALSDTVAKAEQAISVIDKAIDHPGRETTTGLSGIIDPRAYLWGTDSADFQAVSKQLEGKAFLEAFESLKGGGQITEVEGQKATQAIARLQYSQSDAEYKQALLDLREIVVAGLARARQKASLPTTEQPNAVQQPVTSGNKTTTGITFSVEPD